MAVITSEEHGGDTEERGQQPEHDAAGGRSTGLVVLSRTVPTTRSTVSARSGAQFGSVSGFPAWAARLVHASRRRHRDLVVVRAAARRRRSRTCSASTASASVGVGRPRSRHSRLASDVVHRRSDEVTAVACRRRGRVAPIAVGRSRTAARPSSRSSSLGGERSERRRCVEQLDQRRRRTVAAPAVVVSAAAAVAVGRRRRWLRSAGAGRLARTYRLARRRPASAVARSRSSARASSRIVAVAAVRRPHRRRRHHRSSPTQHGETAEASDADDRRRGRHQPPGAPARGRATPPAGRAPAPSAGAPSNVGQRGGDRRPRGSSAGAGDVGERVPDGAQPFDLGEQLGSASTRALVRRRRSPSR